MLSIKSSLLCLFLLTNSFLALQLRWLRFLFRLSFEFPPGCFGFAFFFPLDGLNDEDFPLEGFTVSTCNSFFDGLGVDGFAVDGFAVDGFAVDGFAVDGFAVNG